MVRGLNVERDTSERLSPDDTASLREAEFLEAALCGHRAKVEKAGAVANGECANCGQPLPSDWVYCDQDCKDDHEHRLVIERRQGLRK